MEGFEIINTYTRKQAIEDGVLTDVTKYAKLAGFKLHSVIAEGLMREIILEMGRTKRQYELIVMQILGRAYLEINEQNKKESIIEVSLPWNQTRKYWSHVGPGDEGEPVLTFMMPEDY